MRASQDFKVFVFFCLLLLLSQNISLLNHKTSLLHANVTKYVQNYQHFGCLISPAFVVWWAGYCIYFDDNPQNQKYFSDTGNRTRACWVRASYPNHQTMSDFVILLSNFKFIFTWPLTFFDLEHLHNFISLGVVNIFHVFFPKLCCDCSATFDSKFPVPEVFLSKGHQELNCRGEETSSSINQVLFHNILRVHLNTQIHLGVIHKPHGQLRGEWGLAK